MFSGVATHAMNDHYANELVDASPWRGEASGWSRRANTPGTQFTQIAARYLSGDELASTNVGVQNGRLLGGTSALDTTSASGIGTYERTGAGKHIFAMTPEGQMRSVDPWAAHREVPLGGNDARLELVNHSSLVGGDRVASAGELTAKQGELQQISDQSGHYQPDNPMLYQAVQHFSGQGVDMTNVGVKMCGKSPGEAPLIAAANELAQYGGASDAEKRMRDQRAGRKTEIEQAAARRQPPAPAPAGPDHQVASETFHYYAD